MTNLLTVDFQHQNMIHISSLFYQSSSGLLKSHIQSCYNSCLLCWAFCLLLVCTQSFHINHNKTQNILLNQHGDKILNNLVLIQSTSLLHLLIPRLTRYSMFTHSHVPVYMPLLTLTRMISPSSSSLIFIFICNL